MLAVLIAHLAAALIAPALFSRWGRSAFYALAAVPAVSAVWVAAQWPAVSRGAWTQEVPWVPGLDLSIALRTDHLAWVMSLLVLGVGSLVLAYCARYFLADAPDKGSFGAQLVAFAGVMYGLVVSDDLMLMFIFWEITSVLSFLLISYARTRLSARRSSMQALTITTAGGLAMLIGVVMLGQIGGTYRISELLVRGPELVAAHPGAMSAAMALLLAGAVTKSALIPFHFWLPGAMAAPTPVSAYLHAASMVKAGVYLVARFAPGFSEASSWQPVILVLGLGTMLFGGWVALRQYDLKLVLAYGTVSQLGFMILVLGRGTQDAALAGMALLIGHGLFKATLFLVVGIIDHETGTRDIRKLSGLARQMPVLVVVAIIAAASMAGVPPLAGFVAKEAVLGAFWEEVVAGGGLWAWVRVLGVVVGSILTVAYSARFVWGAFASKRHGFAQLPTGEDGRPMRTPAHRVPALFSAPTVVLTVGTVLLGLWPKPLEKALAPWAEGAGFEGPLHVHLALWHGFTIPLGMTAVVLAAGWLIHAQRRTVAAVLQSLPRLPAGSRVYRLVIDVLDRVAVRVTGATQRGSLTFYLSVILVTAVAVPTIALFVGQTPPLGSMRVADSWGQVVAVVVLIGASLAVLRAGKRFLAVLLVSVTGYCLALIFALQGAPDLALTQLLVETVSLVAFVLALRSLPAPTRTRAALRKRVPRAVLAVAFGAFMMVLALFSMASRTAAPISLAMPRMSYDQGDGANVVNVLLVDIRAWDTFGEVTVLVLAATGIASLIFVQGRADRRIDRQAPDTAQLQVIQERAAATSAGSRARAARAFRGDRGNPYIIAGMTLSPERRSIVLEVITRLVFHAMMMVSLYLLIAGHNLPGGGFAGGLTAGSALVLRYMAGGRYELERATPINAGAMLGLGLATAALYAVTPVLMGGSIMESYTYEWDVPVIGHVKFVTAMVFDVGVYLIVVGLVLDVLRSLGGRIDRQLEDTALERQRRAQGRGARIRVTRARSSEPGATGVIRVLREEPDDPDTAPTDREEQEIHRTVVRDLTPGAAPQGGDAR